MKSGFLDRLIGRLDRLDPESLQTHFLRLVQEKGLLETIFQSIQEGVIVIDARRHRTQEANRRDAVERLVTLVARAAVRPRRRRPTRPTGASRERRIKAKRVRSETKRVRGRVKGQEE